MVGRDHALTQRRQLGALQRRVELGLPDEEALQRVAAVHLQVGEHPQLVQGRLRQALRLVDDDERPTLLSGELIQVLLDRGFYNISGLAWSGRGRIAKVDVSVDGGRNWRPARLESPVMSKCLTRFNLDWVWDGKPALVQSRATDETGHVQPTYAQLRAVRGSRSIYHNNAIQTWLVQDGGEVKNVQLA